VRDCRSWICKYYDLKQIQFMDTTVTRTLRECSRIPGRYPYRGMIGSTMCEGCSGVWWIVLWAATPSVSS